MIPTVIGIVVLAIGLWVIMRGLFAAMFAFTFGCTLMSGSAALQMPALGGASIPPATVATILLVVKLLLHRTVFRADARTGILANSLLLAFTAYGVAGAFLLPRIFEGAILVAPLKPRLNDGMFAVYPLTSTSQNLTVAVNLTITALAAVPAFVMGKRTEAPARIAVTISVLALVNAFLGLYDAVTRGTPLWELIQFFRNGSHAQLMQEIGGLVRIAGIFPEPSTFAAFGFGLLVMTTELWLRGIETRWTGCATVAGLLILFASTSSTAYGSLALYALPLLIRVGLMGRSIAPARIFALAAFSVLVMTGILALVVMAPEVGRRLGAMLEALTGEKANTSSGIQRAFWAKQGLNAFWASWGFGIGAGSFRSSSLVTAVMGSTGIVGGLLFIGVILNVLKPFRAATYRLTCDTALDTGVALSWAAMFMLIPAALSASSPDLTVVWALVAGAALGLRSRSHIGKSHPPELMQEYVARRVSIR